MPHIFKLTTGAVALAAVAGCMDMTDTGTAVSSPSDLALFGTGYPNPGDPCMRAGESAYTSTYLDDAADLVACPPSTDTGLFAFTTGGTQVATIDGWSVFSIPTR